MSQSVQPGWYPDTTAPGRLRYWDGHAWTEHTSPAAPAASVAPPARPSNWFLRHPVVSSVGGVLALLLVVGIAASAAVGSSTHTDASKATGSLGTKPAHSANGAKAGSAKHSSARPKPTPSRPAQPPTEASFIGIVAKQAHAADTADNEIGVVEARHQRSAAVCHLLPTLTATDWIGKVEDISTTLGGDGGVLSVDLTDDIAVQTWNNGVSDIGSHTLISPDSPLYAELADLKSGDEIRFSGHFVRDSSNCLEEQSLMDINGMKTPDFSFRFDAIAKQ